MWLFHRQTKHLLSVVLGVVSKLDDILFVPNVLRYYEMIAKVRERSILTRGTAYCEQICLLIY